MKKLFFLLALFSFGFTFAQAPAGMVKIENENRYDLAFAEADQAFDNKYNEAAKEAAIKTDKDLAGVINELLYNFINIPVYGTVLEINEGSALIVSRRYARHYRVNTAALQAGWEYYFKLRINTAERKQKHCSGCSGVLEAEIIGYSLSPLQARINSLEVSRKTTENEAGYDRSPRY